jgi:hypothetical protein
MFRSIAAAGLLLVPWLAPMAASAAEFSFSSYADFRLVAPPKETSWPNGGLSKFRYGGGPGLRFAEGVGQATAKLDSDFDLVGVARVEPEQRSGVDALEAYASWHPGTTFHLGDGGELGFSLKAGAFFPTISLENDDLGWTSPYTLTPSAINSWIGEELRTIGAEGIWRWQTPDFGTLSLTSALLCCNEPAGILLADRGWAMDDRPTGLFERVRLPDASLQLFHEAVPGRTGEFEQIDNHLGWYAGLSWQMAGIGKLSVLRYDNRADPAAKTARDTGWETKFWSFGARTQLGSVLVIAQQLTGYTEIDPAPGLEIGTKFEAAYLLASYDLDEDWRASARGDVFQTRRVGAASLMDEDGSALTLALSWSGYDWLRLTGEVVAMHSRKGEYKLAGLGGTGLAQSQYQLSAKVFY